MKNLIQVKDLTFKPFIAREVIELSISSIAEKINEEYEGKEVVFVGILNGVFMFAGELMKYVSLKSTINFVRVSSYEGTETTGHVKQVLGLTCSIKDKHVIILEDIIDTGTTVKTLYEAFLTEKPASIEICSMLIKPEKFDYSIPIKYVGMSIPNAFVLGYGLDYDGYGRNLPDIYQLES